MPFLTSGEQLGATDESPDAVTNSIADVNATIAKATKIRQDEHLNGPVILPVEDEGLILSGCGDDDSLELFPEQLLDATRTSREELPARKDVGVEVRLEPGSMWSALTVCCMKTVPEQKRLKCSHVFLGQTKVPSAGIF